MKNNIRRSWLYRQARKKIPLRKSRRKYDRDAKFDRKLFANINWRRDLIASRGESVNDVGYNDRLIQSMQDE